MVCTGTLVPQNTGVPPITSGLRHTTALLMRNTYALEACFAIRGSLRLPGFAAAGGAGGRRLSAVALLGFVLVEHRLRGGLALGAELGAVVAAPLEGGFARPVRVAEMRHDIARV